MSATFAPGQVVRVTDPVSDMEWSLEGMVFDVIRISEKGQVVVGDDRGSYHVNPEALSPETFLV